MLESVSAVDRCRLTVAQSQTTSYDNGDFHVVVDIHFQFGLGLGLGHLRTEHFSDRLSCNVTH